MKYKRRPLYFEQIQPYINDRLIKIITGQRRVGKSYVMNQIKDEILEQNSDANIIYINKEDYAFDAIKNYVDLMYFLEPTIKSKEKTYLFIDEIQEIEEFEKAIRSLQLTDQFDIYCTGSNASLLSGELATHLAGRYIQIRVHSLSYVEYLDFHNCEDSTETFLGYLQFGGMPHLINLRKSKEVYYEYLRNIYDSIILRDVVARYKLRNVNTLQNLIQFLSDNVGSLFSATSISSFLKSQKISLLPKTILEYTELLQLVYFIDGVKRAEIHGKKIFEIGEKFYFEDIGMRNAIIPFQIQDLNKLLENIVYHHLKCMQFDVYIGQLGNKEVDFIATKNDQKYYIQVAYLLIEDTTIEREFGNLEAIKDNYPKLVITMDDVPMSNSNGIEHWNIRKFLLNFGLKGFQ
jgi:predicted AAA+ superfamily ATPase